MVFTLPPVVEGEDTDRLRAFLLELKRPEDQSMALKAVEGLRDRGLDVSTLQPLVEGIAAQLEDLVNGTDDTSPEDRDPVARHLIDEIFLNECAWTHRAAKAIETALAAGIGKDARKGVAQLIRERLAHGWDL